MGTVLIGQCFLSFLIFVLSALSFMGWTPDVSRASSV